MCEKHYRRALHRGDVSDPRLDNMNRYAPDGTCWHWQGPLWANGYGKTSVKIHGTRLAHRAFYAEHVGPIPSGMDLDHLCRNRWCVNPEHLDPVSRAVNLDRGLDARTTCRSGLHDLTLPEAFIPGTKQCVECWRIRYRKASKRYRAKRV